MRVLWERIAIDFETVEATFTREFGRRLKPGSVVFDVGASMGEWSALAGTIAGAECVHMFEPNPPSWSRVRRIFSKNRLGRPGGAFPGFAANEDRFTPEVLSASLAGAWPGVAEGEVEFQSLAEARELPLVRLDTYAQRARVCPDVIKIDVEGAEGEVLRGAATILTESRPVVFLSLHPQAVSQYGDTKEGILTWIQSLGFQTEFLGLDHEEHWMCVPTLKGKAGPAGC